jgi:hypothetical protein
MVRQLGQMSTPLMICNLMMTKIKEIDSSAKHCHLFPAILIMNQILLFPAPLALGTTKSGF